MWCGREENTMTHHPSRATRLIGGIAALILTLGGLTILGIVALQVIGVDLFEVRIWEAGR